MNIRKKIILSITVPLCGFALMAVAAVSQTANLIRIPEVKILDAEFHEYSLNDHFILNVDKADLNKAGGFENIRFRIFAGTIEQLSGEKRYKSADDCYLFNSKSYEPFEYNGGLQFPITFSRPWLGADKNDQLVSQVYVIVFEEQNSTPDILKLHPAQVEGYFARGYQFVVKSPGNFDYISQRRYVAEKKARIRSASEKLKAAAEQVPQSNECNSDINVLVAKVISPLNVARFCGAQHTSDNG